MTAAPQHRRDRHAKSAARAAACGTLLTVALAGCSMLQEDASTSVVTHRFAQPPRPAAACFARNAEAHSSALVAEIGAPDARGHVRVQVWVRNGVPYATAELRPAGRGSEGVLTLMVIARRGTQQLVESLVAGC